MDFLIEFAFFKILLHVIIFALFLLLPIRMNPENTIYNV